MSAEAIIERELDCFFDRDNHETIYLIERSSNKASWYVIRDDKGRDVLGYNSEAMARRRFAALKLQAQVG